jgi:hypothetical protein
MVSGGDYQMKDDVKIRERLVLQHGGATRQIQDPDWVNDLIPSKVYVEGFVSMVCRERGKIVPGTRREGKNIVTLAGREFYARVSSYSSYSPLTRARNDAVSYIGFGVGTTPEVTTVTRLVSPIAYSGGSFLAQLAIPTYPFQTVGSFGTVAQYTREFAETELSVSGTVDLTEAGLFTDGSPTSVPAFSPGTRDTTLANALAQVPNAYRTFEPLNKTQKFVLQIAWQMRF